MSFIRVSLAALAAIAIATSAQAQTVGIGTTKGGATAQTSAGIAKIVSTHSGLQMRPQAVQPPRLPAAKEAITGVVQR